MIRALRRALAARLRRRLGVPAIPAALDAVAARGFQPRLVFDVGAYRGEFARDCLARWPAARIACFEPLADRAAELRRLATREPRVEVFECVVGADDGRVVTLHEGETASSVLREHHATGFTPVAHRMRSVDAIVRAAFDAGPDLLKIDVQGYELEVLKGAEASLADTRIVLAELNFLDIHEGVPLFGEVIEWLGARGWVAYEVCGLTRRPLDGALWQADLMFVRETDQLRTDKRWLAST